jgi:Lipocalin-like domain
MKTIKQTCIIIFFTLGFFACDFTKLKAPQNASKNTQNESIIGKWTWSGVKNNGLELDDFNGMKEWQKCEKDQVKELKPNGDVTTSGSTCDGPIATSTYNSYSLNGNRLSLENATGIVTITKTTMTWILDGSDKDNYIRIYTRL